MAMGLHLGLCQVAPRPISYACECKQQQGHCVYHAASACAQELQHQQHQAVQRVFALFLHCVLQDAHHQPVPGAVSAHAQLQVLTDTALGGSTHQNLQRSLGMQSPQLSGQSHVLLLRLQCAIQQQICGLASLWGSFVVLFCVCCRALTCCLQLLRCLVLVKDWRLPSAGSGTRWMVLTLECHLACVTPANLQGK